MRTPNPKQRWLTFIHNHAKVIVACEFFVVVTATFRTLYVFQEVLASNSGASPVTSTFSMAAPMPIVSRKAQLFMEVRRQQPSSVIQNAIAYRFPDAITTVASASSPRPIHRPRLACAGAARHSPVSTPDKFAVMIMKI